MDKELSDSQRTIRPHKLLVKLSKSQLPGIAPFFKGTIPHTPTLSLEEIADRAVANRCSFHRQELLSAYETMTDEIYRAIEQGCNVDFGLGRTELTVGGRFENEYDRFDRKRHSIQVGMRPSPRLNQLAASFPAEVKDLGQNEPRINEISVSPEPYRKGNVPSFNHLPAAHQGVIFIHGMRLKLMGDDPAVGLHFFHIASETSFFVAPHLVFMNDAPRLAFLPPAPLLSGQWDLEVHTQYNHSYRLYKKPRIGDLSFTVDDVTAPACGE